MKQQFIISVLIVASLLAFGIWKWIDATNHLMHSNGIRPYNSATDKQAIHKMFADDTYWLLCDYTIQHTPTKNYVDFMLDHKSSVQGERRNDLVLKVYEDNGSVVAFSAVYKKSPLVGHILFICVDQSARKKGYAKALVVDALKYFFAQECVKVQLDTRIGNKRSRSLYTALGFQLFNEDEDFAHFVFYKNQPLPQISMQL